jgi:hypothetical protein
MSEGKVRSSEALGQASRSTAAVSKGSAPASNRRGIEVRVDQATLDRRDQKLLRMRSVLNHEFPRESDQVWAHASAQGSGLRKTEGESSRQVYVPHIPPNIMSRQMDRPLSAYLSTKSSKAVKAPATPLDPIPSLTGRESTRTRADLAYAERQKAGYLAGVMGPGLIPFAQGLGLRPQSLHRGPGGDLAKILAEEITLQENTEVNRVMD